LKNPIQEDKSFEFYLTQTTSSTPLMDIISNMCGIGLATTGSKIDPSVVSNWLLKKGEKSFGYQLKGGMSTNCFFNLPLHQPGRNTVNEASYKEEW